MRIDHTWYQRPPHVPEHDSAGGVVVRIEDNCIYFACIGESGLSGHVLPKGRVDPGETLEQAARREIEEEAGLARLTLLDFLGTRERLDFDKRAWKKIHYFLFLTDQINGRPTDPQHESEVKWFPLDELPEMFWPEQRQLVQENRGRIAELLKTKRSATAHDIIFATLAQIDYFCSPEQESSDRPENAKPAWARNGREGAIGTSLK